MLIFLHIILHFQNARYKKLSIQTNEKQEILDYNFSLRCLSEASQTTFFKNLLKDKKTTKTSNGLVLEDKILIYNALNQEQIFYNLVFIAYSKAKNMKKYKIEEVIILANSIADNISINLNNFNDIKITIFTPLEMYAMMKKFNYFPPKPVKKIKEKQNLFHIIFSKKQAKVFLKGAFLLYIASLFVPYTSYYIISASILLLTAGVCFCLNKKENISSSLSKEILL